MFTYIKEAWSRLTARCDSLWHKVLALLGISVTAAVGAVLVVDTLLVGLYLSTYVLVLAGALVCAYPLVVVVPVSVLMGLHIMHNL